jgi:L-aminopeptidase/D-esterase-like protein
VSGYGRWSSMLGTIKVGHAHDPGALTGCTVFLPPEGTVGACEVRGGAPGTRETDLLRPTCTVDGPNAILLTGGSAFGLGAANGVVRFLEEKGVGFSTPAGVVPIVSAAVIFDLDLGQAGVRPDEEMAYRACGQASADEEREGSVGVGMGASVGNLLGPGTATRGGFGLYRFQAGDLKLEVAAVVNCLGDVVDEAGRVLAGLRGADDSYVGSEKLLCQAAGLADGCAGTNTTLVVVATNARLSCQEATRLAMQGHNGIARATRPSHTRYDGDTVFAMATCEVEAPYDALEVLAAMGAAEAIRSAVMRAEPGGGLPCARDILDKQAR